MLFRSADSAEATGLKWAAAEDASPDVERQESVTTEVVNNADVALADTLNFLPKNDASVSLFLNGVHQEQGAGADYTISGQTITWLASSGTAVRMDTNDTLSNVEIILNKGIDVVCAGLDQDSRGKPWETSSMLLGLSDKIVKIYGFCNVCGLEATKTFRKTSGGERTQVGAANIYEPRCLKHWEPQIGRAHV